MSETVHIAIDLGAESGRVMLGRVGEKLTLDEVHRWPSRRARILGSDRWDVLFMWDETLTGLRKAGEQAAQLIASVSCNSWGVDYVLVRDGQPCLTPPFMYRDTRTADAFAKATADGGAEVFAATGVTPMAINTLYQLMSDDPAVHAAADGLLMIGDWFNWLLAGGPTTHRQERSLASTSQLYDGRAHAWSDTIISRHKLPRHLLPELCDAGDDLGTIGEDVAAETGLPKTTKVVASCSHDTGNAVAAMPLQEEAAFLSSGTWSLLGVELDRPDLREEARTAGFTNEVGYGRSIRFQKNLSGLFLVQECRKDFVGEPSYAELARAAADVPAGRPRPATCAGSSPTTASRRTSRGRRRRASSCGAATSRSRCSTPRRSTASVASPARGPSDSTSPAAEARRRC